MSKNLSTQISGTRKLALFLFIVFSSSLIIGGLGLIVAHFITHLELSSPILSNYNNPDTILYMKIIQIFQAFGLFVVPPIIMAYLYRKETKNYLSFRKTSLSFIIVSGLIIIIALPFINWLAEINQSLSLPESLKGIEQWMLQNEKAAENITRHFLQADGISTLLLNLFIMALIPAFGEEMLFRGVLQRLIIQISKNIHIGIWITAFIFSAIHMQFFTFLPRFFMGILFGYMIVWSGSIWLSITAHFINNGTAIIISYLIQKGSVNPDIETAGNGNLTALSLSVILIFSGIYFLKSKAINTNRILQDYF